MSPDNMFDFELKNLATHISGHVLRLILVNEQNTFKQDICVMLHCSDTGKQGCIKGIF